MEEWYVVKRTDWIVQDRFAEIWTQLGGPVDAALFGVRDLRARATDFYFNPPAARIAADLLEEYGAVECQPLDLTRSSLLGPSLLVGDQSIIEGIG